MRSNVKQTPRSHTRINTMHSQPQKRTGGEAAAATPGRINAPTKD